MLAKEKGSLLGWVAGRLEEIALGYEEPGCREFVVLLILFQRGRGNGHLPHGGLEKV